jgi:hypothetical protein
MQLEKVGLILHEGYKYLNFDPSTQDPRTERIKYYTPLSNFVTNILQWLPPQLPQKQMQLP